eukprot:TRINITY_DN10317_c0_g1_i1.p1 TRINITY_DN10317_c0_g1~~TRINITY_DN10317_c0_g1_i1.p1  ORF type:complete len:281 (-),score=21.12 TRINITY_DN10317_c0_g1_i1:659-1501(-)
MAPSSTAASNVTSGGMGAPGTPPSADAVANCIGSACSQAAVVTYSYSAILGGVSLVLSFIGNGTHGTFAKLAGPSTPPFVYNVYLCAVLVIGSMAALLGVQEDFEWTVYGFGSGVLLAACLVFYVNAIVRIGIVWCDILTASCATLVSFTWGKLYFSEPSRDIGVAAVGMLVLLLGIFAISGVLAKRLRELEGGRADRTGQDVSHRLGLGHRRGCLWWLRLRGEQAGDHRTSGCVLRVLAGPGRAGHAARGVLHGPGHRSYHPFRWTVWATRTGSLQESR